jgi:hypothetical protein
MYYNTVFVYWANLFTLSIFTGKKYKCIDVSAMLCMCIGLILFTLADSSVSPSFNTYGRYKWFIMCLN